MNPLGTAGMFPDTALKISQLLQAAAALVLAWRLLHFRLVPQLTYMFALQVWTVISSVGVFAANRNADSYFWFYLISIPISAIVNILAVSELLAIVFDRYPGIRTVGRWIMFCSVGLAVLLSLLWAKSSWSQAINSPSSLGMVELAQRSVVFSLAVFILCILFCLSRYPLHLPRNFSISSSLFCTIFLTETLVILLDTLTPKLENPYFDLAQMMVSVVCLFTWAFLLRPMGFTGKRRTGPPVREVSADREEDKVLLAKLDSLNKMMSKAARR